MEFLRDSTVLRAYGGKDPLVEYKKERLFSLPRIFSQI